MINIIKKKTGPAEGMFFASAMVCGLYTAFVVQHLWNWFVAPTCHFAAVGYLTMYGMFCIVDMIFFTGPTVQAQRAIKLLLVVSAASVPAEKEKEVEGAIEEVMTSWGDLFTYIFNRLAANTLTLIVGWIISGLQ